MIINEINFDVLHSAKTKEELKLQNDFLKQQKKTGFTCFNYVTIYKHKKSKHYNKAYFGYKNLNKFENYFGSSKIIKAFQKKYKNKYFERYIVGLFKTTEEGAKNESKILKQILKNGNNVLWLNKSIQGYLLTGSPIVGFNEKEKLKYKKMCKEKGNKQRGENNPNYGKRWTPEQRKKMSELIVSKKMTGKNNPNYGNGFKISKGKNPAAVKTIVVIKKQTFSFDTKTEAFEFLKNEYNLKSHRFLCGLINKGPFVAKQKRHLKLNGIEIKTLERKIKDE